MSNPIGLNQAGSDNGNLKGTDGAAHVTEVNQADVDSTRGVRRVEQQYDYKRLNSAATTTVKTGSGVLHAVNIGVKAAVASTLTLYDNTAASGTVIAVFDCQNPTAGSHIMDVQFTNGLTAVISAGTPDLTLSLDL